MAARPPQLDYDPPPSRAVLSRVRLRRWLLRALAAAAMISPLWWGPILWNNAKTIYWHRACAAYTAPPDQVVYEEDFSQRRVIVSRSLPCWDNLQPLIKYNAAPTGKPVLFLGTRDAGEHGRQLLAVEFEMNTWNSLALRTCLVDPPGYSGARRDVFLPSLARAKRLRIYAGQPDPVDAARFTIPCEIDGRRVTLNGRVKPGGRMEIDADEARPPENASSVYRLFRGPEARPPALPPVPLTPSRPPPP